MDFASYSASTGPKRVLVGIVDGVDVRLDPREHREVRHELGRRRALGAAGRAVEHRVLLGPKTTVSDC